MEKWYLSDTDNINVISSRIRLARNLNKYPFSVILNDADASSMIKETLSAVKDKSEAFENYLKFIDVSALPNAEKWAMLENHMLSPELLKKKGPKGIICSDDESLGIMLNEEDHIRIQSIFPGDNIDAAWDLADKTDNLIEETLEYAFDQNFGYLTSCPTNTGTGMRASFMLHIPMLEKSGQLKHILSTISKFGLTIRGMYGEGTESLGGIYQISNQLTMGKSEHEIITALKNVTKQITENEDNLRIKALNSQKIELEDRVYRSLGILTNARKIAVKEAMGMLSDIRLGYACGILKTKPNSTIYNIMMNIQPGNLQCHYGHELSEKDAAIYRAEYLRNAL